MFCGRQVVQLASPSYRSSTSNLNQPFNPAHHVQPIDPRSRSSAAGSDGYASSGSLFSSPLGLHGHVTEQPKQTQAMALRGGGCVKDCLAGCLCCCALEDICCCEASLTCRIL
ncbi:hypothetical protein RQP46_011156 [Phenoliferia psychrophenolica]